MKRFYFLVSIIFFIVNFSDAQNIGIGTSSPHSSAMLDISSNSKGTLITRMTTAQRKAIASPALGLLVYDLNKRTIYMWDGNNWLPFLYGTTEDKIPATPFVPTDLSATAAFGTTVSISGNYAVVGAPNDHVGANVNQGSAYIYFRSNNTWQQQAKITAADGAANNLFGTSVSINGDYVIVGAPNNTFSFGQEGSAYVFTRSGTSWTQQAKLTASNWESGSHFGTDVAISGANVVIGCPGKTIGSNLNQGNAYIFSRSGTVWTEQIILSAGDGAAGDGFGTSVGMDGGYAVIGAPYDDIGVNQNQGSAWVYGPFLGIPWTPLAKLTASNGAAGNEFGFSVSISGNYAVIGAWQYNNVMGTAYVFNGVFGIWNTGQPFEAQLSPVNGKPSDFFAHEVSISGDYIIAGIPGFDLLFPDCGRVYVYKRNGTNWDLIRTIDDANPEATGRFGYAVAIDGFDIILGAALKNNNKGETAFLNIE